MKVTTSYILHTVFLGGLITLLFAPQNVMAAVSAGELKALTDIYNTMGGANWIKKANWGSGDPCSPVWAGVVCTGASVTSLVLDSNNLTGSFPSSFSGLQNLGRLSALRNSIILRNLNSFFSTLPSSVNYL